jgi:lambda repressor-like predicted transcriptional regulator
MTLELMGQNTQIPITIDADWAPEQIMAELSKIGLGLPDLLSEKTRILNGRMDTYLVMADKLEAPTTEIHEWKDSGPYHAIRD